ncbi:MAG TPA: gluconate 2-dehydrogenase subunit 3 family protein [Cyclobacteriaceae bacterium]|nr:gluconate 2-dehydrogenase subunit 3 family protein [Cyclobacteriaceae bacterium]
MNRREALSAVSFLLGGTIIGAEAFLSGCSKPSTKSGAFLNGDQISFLDEVGEVIIPETASSGGARAAKIGEFMDIMLQDCYNEDEKKIFLDGLEKMDALCRQEFDKPFTSLQDEDKNSLLLKLEEESRKYNEGKKPGDTPHYYTMIKQLTIMGYFSSEIGITQALRHVAVPGRYDACIPIQKGEKAWG